MSQLSQFVTVAVSGATTMPTDSGTATPTGGGAITFTGGTNIGTTGAGNAVTINLAATIAVSLGGTGATSLTDHGVLIGSATSAITPLTVGTDGQVLLGDSANDPVFATLTSTGTIAFTAGAGTLALNCRAATDALTGVVELATDAEATAGSDSTRAIVATSLKAKLGAQTANGMPYGAGDSTAIAWTSAATDGQILIGDTGSVPLLGTLTAGTGITITNAAGSITVASLNTTLNNQTGTTYTLVLTDAGKFITFTNGGAITVTVPTNAAVAFPIGTQIGVQQGGAGQVTFAGAVPPTLQSADNAYKLVKIYSVGALIKIASDVWALAGDMEA